MAELEVKEITELNDVSFTNDSLLLAYTEDEGVGKTTFAKAKELIGSNINIEQTQAGTEASAVNKITATIRNGGTTETKEFIVKNGTGISQAAQTESTDENGLRSNSVSLKSSDTSLVNDVNFTVKDGVGIKEHSLSKSTDENGLSKSALSVKYTDGKTDTAEISDGVGIKSASQTTSSSLSGELNEYTVKLTDGTTSSIKVYNGRAGKDFRIKKTYSSVAAMQEDFSGADVDTFEFAMIDTGSVEDADTGKLYCKTETEWSYIGDLSGAQGIKGDTGNGIASITDVLDENNKIKITIAMTDGTEKSFVLNNGVEYTAGTNIEVSSDNQISAKVSADTFTGTLPIAKGGTGVTTQDKINQAFVAQLPVGDSDVTDGTEFVSSYASNNGFSDTNALNVPHRRKFSSVWNYIKDKISSVLGLEANNLFYYQVFPGSAGKSSYIKIASNNKDFLAGFIISVYREFYVYSPSVTKLIHYGIPTERYGLTGYAVNSAKDVLWLRMTSWTSKGFINTWNNSVYLKSQITISTQSTAPDGITFSTDIIDVNLSCRTIIPTSAPSSPQNGDIWIG